MARSVYFRMSAFCALMFVSAIGLGEKVFAQSEVGFEFILHNDLSDRDVAHLHVALHDSRSTVLAALGLSDMPPVTVQVWRDKVNYQDAMEQTLGMRAPGSRGYVTGPSEIRLLYHQMLSAQREAVHEFVHAATLALNPGFGNNPRWLWEAVAQYLAGEFVDPSTASQFQGGKCPSLETLNSPFDSGGAIYRSGYLLGEFITASWSAAKLRQLISANGDIETILGITENDFETRWCGFVQSKYFK